VCILIYKCDIYELMLIKVEGEKTYHLIATILGEVKAEVSSWLCYFQKRIYDHFKI
jgi:hypothetical protein